MRPICTVANLLAVSSYAAAAAIELRTTTCNAEHVKFVKARVDHATYFCDFYLSTNRINSPFNLLDAADVWSACQCISAAASTPRVYSTVSPPTGTGCSAYREMLITEYDYPPAFCTFYMFMTRTLPTIPGVSVADLVKGCECLSGTSTTSSGSTSTTTTSTTAAQTATSTCSTNVLSSAAGDFVDGLAYWTATAAPTAYASVSTGTSYDTTGSAALLTCQYASAVDSHASICSEELSLCAGQNYTISYKYKFSASGSDGGSLYLYDYGLDEMLSTITGPTSSSATDSDGVSAGSWGTASQTFQAAGEDDMVCVLLQCLSSTTSSDETAKVTIDNVRVTRVT